MSNLYEKFVYRMKGLTQNEKFLLIRVASFKTASQGALTKSQSEIGNDLGMSARTVRRCATRLEQFGLIEVVLKEGRGVEYHLSDGFLKRLEIDDITVDPGHGDLPPRTECPTTPDTVSYIDSFSIKEDYLTRKREVISEQPGFSGRPIPTLEETLRKLGAEVA